MATTDMVDEELVNGAVSYEDGKYVFEMAQVPAATMPNVLKLLAKRILKGNPLENRGRRRRLVDKMGSGQEDKAHDSTEPSAAGAGALPQSGSDPARAAQLPVDWEPIDEAAARDKVLGCFLGLAVGDALGAAVEFSARDSFPPIDDMRGGGPFLLPPGQWIDDTTMALCLAESLLANKYFDAEDFMNRLRAWLEKGENTAVGKCFDIGNATRMAVESFIGDGNPAAGSTDPHTAGNGSLVRLGPVAIASRDNADIAIDLAQRQSRSTHAAQEALGACSLFTAQLVDALNGADKQQVLRQRVMALTTRPLLISAGDWKSKTRAEISSSGYVVRTLEAALWCVWNTENFRDAVLLAVNLGDDADSVGAVAGQLAGALYGSKAIPPEWLAKLIWRDKIEQLAGALFDQSRGR
jgi:ADP-ribosyl-[dinitrogen reductase] hydrolase